MAFAGKYELVKNEGFLEHLIATGIPEEIAKRNAEQTKFEITLNGDKLGIQRGDGQFNNYVLNQEVESKTPTGETSKTKAEINGNVLTLTINTDKGTRKLEMTISGSELTLVSSHSKAGVPVAKRIFKKL